MSKGWKVTFYITTIILSLSMLWGGYLDAVQNPLAVESMMYLGYPAYFATILGVAKILGVIGIWQNKVKFLKEWAYAGFVFDTLCAIISSMIISGMFSMALPAFISLIVVLLSYISAKKINRI